MKGILFRGKTTPKCIGWDDKKEEEIYSESKWIYGGYGEIYGGSYIMTQPFMKHITAGGSRWMDEEIDAIRVQKETVGQYTGIDDVNGNKIFEGDIVKVELVDGEYFTTGYVRKDEASYVVFGKEKWKVMSASDSYEILGNTTDNPELLK